LQVAAGRHRNRCGVRRRRAENERTDHRRSPDGDTKTHASHSSKSFDLVLRAAGYPGKRTATVGLFMRRLLPTKFVRRFTRMHGELCRTQTSGEPYPLSIVVHGLTNSSSAQPLSTSALLR